MLLPQCFRRGLGGVAQGEEQVAAGVRIVAEVDGLAKRFDRFLDAALLHAVGAEVAPRVGVIRAKVHGPAVVCVRFVGLLPRFEHDAERVVGVRVVRTQRQGEFEFRDRVVVVPGGGQREAKVVVGAGDRPGNER